MRTPSVVTVEEHYWDDELVAAQGTGSAYPEHWRRKLGEIGEGRIAELDRAGIDVQIISHAPPGPQTLEAKLAVPFSRAVNDRLHGAIGRYPDRFEALAVLPTAEPEAAADELERCVRDLRFKGAAIFGLSRGEFIDLRKYWPIFGRAEALGVPIYLHPAKPQEDVARIHYGAYGQTHPTIMNAGWAFTVETATQAVRLILSGLFEEHPRLTFILGHLGEGLPFLLWRIDESFRRAGNRPSDFAQTFRRNFYISTSGFFSDRALAYCVEEMGSDRILFAVDWPFADNESSADWLRQTALPDVVKTKILGRNAVDLFKLGGAG